MPYQGWALMVSVSDMPWLPIILLGSVTTLHLKRGYLQQRLLLALD